MGTKKKNEVDLNGINAAVSRRFFLQMLGGAGAGLATAAGAAAAPQKKQAVRPRTTSRLKDVETTVLWSDPMQGFDPSPGKIQFGSSWYAQGMACVLGAPSPSLNLGTPYMLQLFDIHSGANGGNFNNYPLKGPLGNLTLSNGILSAPYAVGDGTVLWAVAAGSNAVYSQPSNIPLQALPLSNVVSLGKRLAWVDIQNNLCFASLIIDPSSGMPLPDPDDVTAPIPLGDTYSFAAIDSCDPTQFAVAAGQTGYTYDNTTNPPARRSLVTLTDGSPLYAITTPQQWFAVGGGSIEAWDWDATGSHNWIWQNGNVAISKPVVANGCVYFCGADGYFTCLDAITGKFLWNSHFGEASNLAQIFVEDGIAYWSSNGGNIFAIDVSIDASQDHLPARQDMSASPGRCIGVESGVCIVFALPDNGIPLVMAVDMAGQVHQFSASCSRMPDTVVGEPSNFQNSNPTYHAAVGIKDPLGNPRANISVKLTVYEDCTISDEASTYSCKAGVPLWLSTDASGYLSLSVQADDLGCPGIYLWATFMDRDETMVIYPDDGLVPSLMELSPSDLSSGTTYDHSPLLKNSANASTAQQFLQKTLAAAGVGSAMAAAREAQRRRGTAYAAQKSQRRNTEGRVRVLAAAAQGDPNAYISYPSTKGNVLLYQYPSGAPALRPYSPTSDQIVSLVYDGTTLSNPPSSSEVTAMSQSTVGLDWDDFKTLVIHGANDIKTLTTVLNPGGLYHLVEDNKGNNYNLSIKSIEDALKSVAGLFKSICNGIKDFIEFLTDFDWKDVLSVKEILKSNFCQNVASFTGKVTADVATWTKDVQGVFTDITGDIDNWFSSVDAMLGTTSISTASASGGGSGEGGGQDLSTVFKVVDKIDSFSPFMKIYHKVMSKIHIATFGNNSPVLSGSYTTVCAAVTLDDVIGQLQQQILGAKEALGQDAINVFNDMIALLQDMKGSLINGFQFSTTSLATIINLFKDIVNNVLNAVATCIEFVLNMIPILLQAFYWFITVPINIPVISSLYKAIADDQLTILDAICLLVAVPASMITKAAGLPRNGLGAVNQFHVYWAIPTVLGSMVDAACDSDPDNSADSIKSYFDWAFPAFAFFMQIPNLPGNDKLSDVFYSLQLLSWIPPFAALMIQRYVADASTGPFSWVNKGLPYFNCGYGLLMLGLSIYGAVKDSSNFDGKDHLSLIANVCSCLPYIGKPAVQAGEVAQTVEMAVDVVAPCANAILTLVEAGIS